MFCTRVFSLTLQSRHWSFLTKPKNRTPFRGSVNASVNICGVDELSKSRGPSDVSSSCKRVPSRARARARR